MKSPEFVATFYGASWGVVCLSHVGGFSFEANWVWFSFIAAQLAWITFIAWAIYRISTITFSHSAWVQVIWTPIAFALGSVLVCMPLSVLVLVYGGSLVHGLAQLISMGPMGWAAAYATMMVIRNVNLRHARRNSSAQVSHSG